MSGAPLQREPAIKSYFFGKGFQDLQRTMADSWRRNMASAEVYRAKGDSADSIVMKSLWWSSAAAVLVFGTVIFVVASAVHITILAAFLGSIYLLFSLVYLLEHIFLLIKGFNTVCPDCHTSTPLPEYLCDGCGSVHARLVPSSYGILWHICDKCGTKLPATFFLNRGRLQSRCGKCASLLLREHTETRKLFIRIIGGPSVGKSSYMYSMIWKLLEQRLPQLGLTGDFLEARNKNAYEEVRRKLMRGAPPDKTMERIPSAFNLQIKRENKPHRFLYVYDPAGEAFADGNAAAQQKYQGYVNGAILLIDPFSIPGASAEYAQLLKSSSAALKPSSLDVEEALARVVLAMEEAQMASKTSAIKFPLAVVVNKADALMLPAVDRAADAKGHSDALRAQLDAWGARSLLQKLDLRFSHVQFFASSALGRLPDDSGEPFEPRNVIEPLMWILSEADRSFSSQA